jgi:hypothetical protein
MQFRFLSLISEYNSIHSIQPPYDTHPHRHTYTYVHISAPGQSNVHGKFWDTLRDYGPRQAEVLGLELHGAARVGPHEEYGR